MMPKISASQTFLELKNNGTINKEDPTTLFTDLNQIGAGNFGIVYRARRCSTGENVAIKKLKYDARRKISLEDLNDMIREIRFLSIIKHKNCVASKGCYLDQQTPWLVMEYCLGSVADILEVQRRPLAELEIACIVKEVLNGLIFIHSFGYIHRDIKAANILFSENGVIKISDFGSASFKNPANSFVGTPFWIAPDVIMAMENGIYYTNVDVWSLGITCIEMAELKPPYMDSVNGMAALYQIALQPPPTLRAANWSPQFHNFVEFVLKKTSDERPSSSDAAAHLFCSSVSNTGTVLSELVQLALANVNEENQVRPTRLKKMLHDNRLTGHEVSDDLVVKSAECNSMELNGHRRMQPGQLTPRDISYDSSQKSESTADGASSGSVMQTPSSFESSMSGVSSLYFPSDSVSARTPTTGIWQELLDHLPTDNESTSFSRENQSIKAPQIRNSLPDPSSPALLPSTINVSDGNSLPSEVSSTSRSWDTAKNDSADLSPPPRTVDGHVPKSPSIVPKTPQAVVAAARIGNFPTLKSKQMLQRAQLKKSQGDYDTNSAFPDEFYSFGALKRLCARHAKKLEHERIRLKEIEDAKMAELNREYTKFISSKKKSVCVLQETHDREMELESKRATDEEARLLRQLDLTTKDKMKQTRKSLSRPKSMASFPVSSISSSASPFSDSSQPELTQLFKRLQSDNNLKVEQWRYEAILKRYRLQLSLFAQRQTLKETVVSDRACILLSQHEQLREVELRNLVAKHELQHCHLTEKRAFFCNEQKRYEETQHLQFEKEKRVKAKNLEKELKHLDDSLRPSSKVTSWFLGRKKRSSGSPVDKLKVEDLSKYDSKLDIEEIRHKKRETLERTFSEDAMKLTEKMASLRGQMNLYHERRAQELIAQQAQEQAELNSRILLRAEKLEEAIKRSKQTFSDEILQEKRRIDIDFHARRRCLEEECQKLGVDFRNVQMHVENSIDPPHL